MLPLLRFSRLVKISILAAASTYPVSADTIVDTGPGQTQGYALALGVHNRNTNAYQFIAGQFQLDGPTRLNSVNGWIYTDSGGTLVVRVARDTDSLPGLVLYSGNINLGAGLQDAWHGINNLDWVLDAGTYWVTFASPDNLGGMAFNVANPLANYALNEHGFWYSPSAAVGVQITGDSLDGLPPGYVPPVPQEDIIGFHVPESGMTLGFIISSLAVLLTVHRKIIVKVPLR
jgi:hypothetical protein